MANHLAVEFNYYRKGFSDKIKSIAYDLYGFTGKDGKDRETLQLIGNELRKPDPEVWIKYLLRQLADIREETWGYAKFVVDDIRYANEAEVLRANGFTIIDVTCDEAVRMARVSTLYPNVAPAALQHASEHEWQDIKADYVIDTTDTLNGLDELDNLMARLNNTPAKRVWKKVRSKK